MALTPEDVVNKRFQPTKFREGYDQDEVDDFLDEVVVELRRLNQENDELRQRLAGGEGGAPAPASAPAAEAPAPASAPAAPASAPAPTSVQAPVEAEPVVEPAPVSAAPVSAAPVSAAAVAPVPAYAGPTEDETTSTNNLLQLARRLHEEHVREGVEKRDALIAEGRQTAERVVTEAEARRREIVAEAEATQREVLADTERTKRETLEQLSTERTGLERKIDDLRSFERDYRQKLKGYIEGQLRELDGDQASTTGGLAPASAQGFGSN